MALQCPSLSPDGPFLVGMLDYIDCQAQTIGEAGYRALASPASSLSPLLTLALTIFVALIGYRLLIGEPPRGRELVIAAVKVGMVLVLATSWPAFRTLAYDVVMSGPANLAQNIGGPAGIPGANGGLVARLQNVDDAIAELLVRGSGSPAATGGTVLQPAAARWTPYDPLRNAAMLEHSRTVYLVSSVAAFASVRLVAGLLLALGPLFALFLLFDGTRGFFEGWLRALAGAALAATAISLILGVELALFEPWLSQVLGYRRAGIGVPAVSVQLLVASLVFALALLAALLASVKVAHGFRFPVRLIQAPLRWADSYRSNVSGTTNVTASASATYDDRSRAHAVADAVAATQRRESANDGTASRTPARANILASRMQEREDRPVVREARTPHRRTRNRLSATARRRDGV